MGKSKHNEKKDEEIKSKGKVMRGKKITKGKKGEESEYKRLLTEENIYKRKKGKINIRVNKEGN